jgi:tetratricopeptide (TPR) repeat protein
MKKRFFLCALLIITLFHCATDKHVRTIGDDDDANIEIIQAKLLDYQNSKNIGLLMEAENDLKQIEKRGKYNKQYRAKVFGLYGMVYFYKNDKSKVKKYIEEIEYTNKGEEYYYILQALLEKSPDAQIMILNQGEREADTNLLIKLELAEIYFAQADYRSAAALYDRALKGLPAAFKEHYKKNRDLAYHYMKNPSAQTSAQDIMKENTLTMSHVIGFLHAETGFFDHLAAKKDIRSVDLLKKLKDAGYVHNKKLSTADVCSRKDLAYLLLKILVFIKNDQSLLDKYSKKYMGTGRKSPIPDINTSDYFFDAALILVEREIMSLPDGQNFFPHRTVSGLELSTMVKKLKAQ